MKISSTTTLVSASTREWDVIVIGAGPAGGLAAHQLSQQGHRVLAIDKSSFPRAKVCGGCFNRRSVAALEACGLSGMLSELNAKPVLGLRMMAGTRYANVPLQGGVSVSRYAFDAALLAAMIKAGADFLSETRVRETHLRGDRRIVVCQGPAGRTELAAKVVVDAHGLAGLDAARGGASGHPTDSRSKQSESLPSMNPSSSAGESPLAMKVVRRSAATKSSTQAVAASRIGAGTLASGGPHLDEGTIYMACGKHGYLGAVRVEGDQVDLAAALDPTAVRQMGVGRTAAAIAQEAGLPSWPELADYPWMATPLLTRYPSTISAERMFSVGDAAGYVEPFTGEGIAWALHGAIAASHLAARAISNGWDVDLERAWAREHRRIIRRRQWLIRSLATITRRPWLTSTVIAALKICPWASAPFTRWLDMVPKQAGQP